MDLCSPLHVNRHLSLKTTIYGNRYTFLQGRPNCERFSLPSSPGPVVFRRLRSPMALQSISLQSPQALYDEEFTFICNLLDKITISANFGTSVAIYADN